MIWLLRLWFRRLKPLPPVQADPPGWDVPLDQTMAPLHRRGDVTSV
jgi:hypothetical protein